MDERTRLLFDAPASDSLVKKLMKKPVNYKRVIDGTDLLCLAVKQNNVDKAREMVRRGALPNNPNVTVSPLLLAIKSNADEMVVTLIQLGANLKSGQIRGMKISPLRFAVRCLLPGMVELLVEKGANVLDVDPETRRTALHEVGDFLDRTRPTLDTTKVRIEMAKFLLKKNADICAKDINCRTPLDGAIIDNAALSKFLIQSGAPVRRTMDNGFVIDYVLYIVNLKSPELVRLCLERGGNPNHVALVDDRFITAYHRAVQESTPQVVKVFWQFGTPIDQPMPGSNKHLVKSSKEINKSNKDIFSIQFEFLNGICNNNINQVMKAIDKGAEPKGTCLSLSSPLHHLAGIDNPDLQIVRLLLERGVPVNQLDPTIKKSSVVIAMVNRNVDVMKVILMYGGCLKKEDLESFLMFNPKRNYTIANEQIRNIIKEILTAFKLTKKGSNRGVTRIEDHLNSGRKTIVKIIMNSVDSRGRSLMSVALQKGHFKIAEKLMEIRLNHL